MFKLVKGREKRANGKFDLGNGAFLLLSFLPASVAERFARAKLENIKAVESGDKERMIGSFSRLMELNKETLEFGIFNWVNVVGEDDKPLEMTKDNLAILLYSDAGLSAEQREDLLAKIRMLRVNDEVAGDPQP